MVSFVRGEMQSKAVEEAAKEATVNPDEIELGDDSSEEEEEEETVGKTKGVETQDIPAQVFGGLKKDE